LGREMNHDRHYSETIAADIDHEVSNFLHKSYQLAKKVITSRKKALDAIANKLIEEETLEQEEFNAVIKPFDLKPLPVS